MQKFIERYITSKGLKESYLLLGALIALSTLIQGAFGDLFTSNFLLGVILFVSLIIFIYILAKTVVVSQKYEDGLLTPIIYIMILSLFIIGWMISIALKYGKTFSALWGLITAYLILAILAQGRVYFVIFQRDKIKNQISKKLLRVLFFIVIFLLMVLYFNYVGTQTNFSSFSKPANSTIVNSGNLTELQNYYVKELGNISAKDWRFFVSGSILIIVFFSMLIISLIDIFIKEPLWSKNYAWKKSKLYRLLKSF